MENAARLVRQKGRSRVQGQGEGEGRHGHGRRISEGEGGALVIAGTRALEFLVESFGWNRASAVLTWAIAEEMGTDDQTTAVHPKIRPDRASRDTPVACHQRGQRSLEGFLSCQVSKNIQLDARKSGNEV